MKKYASGHGFSLCSLAYFHEFKYIVYGFLDMYKSVVVLNFLSHISVVCHDLLIQRRRVSVFHLQQGQHSCRASLPALSIFWRM